MTILQLAAYYGHERAIKRVEKKHGIKIKKAFNTLDLIVAVKAMAEGSRIYVKPVDIVDFFSCLKTVSAKRDWVMKRLKEAIDDGFIEKHPRERGLYKLSLQGEAALRCYNYAIVDTIEELRDTGALPEYYEQEWNDHIINHRTLKTKYQDGNI